MDQQREVWRQQELFRFWVVRSDSEDLGYAMHFSPTEHKCIAVEGVVRGLAVREEHRAWGF